MAVGLRRPRWSGVANFQESRMYNEFNPATGLPMVGGIGGVDVAGNPWGVNPWSSSLPEDDDDF